MVREKVKLTPEKRPTGIRYRRMYKGHVWTSKTYPEESRRNKQEAWEEFKEWRDRQQAEQPAPVKDDPLATIRELCRTRIQTLIDHAELTADAKEGRQWRLILAAVPTAAEDRLFELTALLFGEVNDVSYQPLIEDREQTVARLKKHSPSDLAASALADEYCADLARKADTERVSQGYSGQVKAALDVFVTWYGPSRSLAGLTERVVRDYTTHLEDQIKADRFSRNTAHNYQQAFRAFVTAMAENYPDDVPLPKNLRSTRLRIGKERKEPVTFDVKEVRLLLDNAVPRTRLFLLLMLNCGMYQGDIADLQADEIDWTAGRIIRPRSKTRRMARTRGKHQPFKLNWLLWRAAWELLKEFGHREGLVLRTQDGTPLIKEKSSTRNDAVRSAYCRLVAKLKRQKKLPADWNKTLKSFRKTGVNLLEKSEQHGPTLSTYLAHSVAKQNYLTSGEPVAGLDAAVTWLGKQFGIE